VSGWYDARGAGEVHATVRLEARAATPEEIKEGMAVSTTPFQQPHAN
jgi:hypothetical protein